MSSLEERQHLKELLLTVSRFDDGLALTLGGITGHLYERVEELEKLLNTADVDLHNMFRNYKKIKSENQRYKQALEFYAKDENWKVDRLASQENWYSRIESDTGEIARQALEADKL